MQLPFVTVQLRFSFSIQKSGMKSVTQERGGDQPAAAIEHIYRQSGLEVTAKDLHVLIAHRRCRIRRIDPTC
jgi:hypothetical protein